MMKSLILTFIPIFIAVDAFGVLPIFIALTRGMPKKIRFEIILKSIITATLVALSFIFLGNAVFRLLGITMGDFMVAGGLVLFLISINDILYPGKKRRVPANEMGIVPLGTPLIVGPAVLTISLILVNEYGAYVTFISIVINVVLAGVVFSLSDMVNKILGDAGIKAISKIASLLLASIAVMMIRKGVSGFINNW